MNNQAKLKLEKIKKLKLPEKVRATADKIEKGLSSADAATQKKAEDALNKLYDQIKAVAAKQREEKTEKEVNEKTIVPQNSDIAAPAAKKELTKKTTVADDVIDKALKNDPELAGFGRSDKRRDAGRKALPAGRRVARKGWANQFGKSDGGRVYYENRENRKDRKSPSYKSGYPYLAKGGKIHPMDDEDGTFYVNLYKTKGDQMMSVDEREYTSKASAMTYAMMKRDFMKEGESIFVMNDDGDVLYTSIGTKKMAMGGKFPYQNAQVGDSARVILDNKMGTIMVTYGRRFHLKFPDGTEKTYSAEELEFYPENDMMAKGGYMAEGENYEYVNTFKRFDSNVPVPQEDFEKLVDAYHKQLSGDKLAVSKYKVLKLQMGNYLGYKTVEEMVDYIEKTHDAHKMAKGGYVDIEAKLIKELQKLQRDLNSDRLNTYSEGDNSDEEKARQRERESKLVRFNEILELLRENDAKKMAKGGMMDNGGEVEPQEARFDVTIYDEDNEKYYLITYAEDEEDAIRKAENWYGVESVDSDVTMVTDYDGKNLYFAKGGMMDNGVDYVELINLIKSADNPRNLPIYYNSASNVVNIGGVGYDKAELVKMFNARAGQSLEIKNLFYQANQYPQETKNRIESMNVGIEVEIGKGYGNETFVKYIKMAKGGYMADGGTIKGSNPSTGEKFGVVIGSLKKEDGLTTLTIRSSYSARIKSYELTFDEKGFLRSIGDFGHTIDGTYPDMKGGHLSVKNVDADNKKESIDALAKITSPSFAKKVYDYVQEEKMAKGGYVPKRDIEAITIVNPNKSNPKKNYLTFRSGEFLNGLNQFAKGGKLTDNYTYIKRSDIFAVYYKDKAKKYNSIMESKPKNGFWVSKKALIREGGKTPSAANAPFDAYESYDEFAKLNYKVWDKLKIESGSEIYASDSLQKKLAVEYPNSGIDAKFKNLKAVQRKKVAEIMTDENEHILRNYLTLRGYLGQKEYDEYASIFEPKRRYVLNPANFKNYTADKVKVGSVLTSNTGVKVKVVEYNPQYGVKVLRLDATEADKPSQYINLSKFDGFEKMADGGKIGFEALSKKVASRYAGKKVQPKYQGEYGKTYDKAEAKEVGDKVAAKVYRMQQGKMAMGGKIELPYELDKYFTKPAGTIEVEMSKLIPIRARKEGIENAEVYMKKAYDGKMSKRKPIEIYKTRNKKYRVNDGNSTYAVAKKNGWETIYATVVSNPNVSKRAEKSTFAIAKEIRKEGEKWSDAVKRVKENRK